MVRATFNPARTDGYTYTTGANPDHVMASGAVGGATNEYSYTNQDRTQMRIRINLRSILGSKEYDSKETFCIKLTDVSAILESGTNLPMITHVSPSWIRTSNVVIYGPNFVGGANEIILGQVGNYNQNEQFQFFLEFHRADFNPNQFYLRCFNGGLANFEGVEFAYDYLLPINTNTAEKANRRWQWNYREQQGYNPVYTDTNPSMENKPFTITDAVVAVNGFLVMTIAIANETATTRTGSNFPITLTSLPLTPEQWYMVKRDYTKPDDYDYGIEAWFHKPKNDYVDITLELRDLLQNKLQPVMPIPAGKVLPPFTFVFDIY